MAFFLPTLKKPQMTKKVLVADDEPGVSALATAILNRGGKGRFQVLLARDSEEALSVARREKPDLIFLDILMPKLDGYEVCEKLKSDSETSRITVVMVTALGGESNRQKSAEAGGDGFITKPYTPSVLLAKAEEVLGLR